MRTTARWLVALLLPLAACVAHAGRNCEAALPLKLATVEKALALAERTLSALDRSGADVVVLARAGQDLQKYGLTYSHLGFAYREPAPQGGTVWRVLHKLNTCGSASSAIYKQGLGEFFLDDLWRFEAAWVVPTPAVQARLIAVLQSPTRALLLHHAPYSMVSYAWGQTYQQSNQWALETMAMAMGSGELPGIDGRLRAQDWLRARGYQPTTLNLGPLTRLGGRVTQANIAFDDHPTVKRFSNRIETVTVDSVFDWMQRAQLTQSPVVTLR
jgi:hypothetical protein